MGRSESCHRCDTTVSGDEWFCSNCGRHRYYCPECGSELNDEGCPDCGQPRLAPCAECESYIDIASVTCPECGHNENKRIGKRRLALGGGIIAVGYGATLVLSGGIVDLIGTVLSIPFYLFGGLLALGGAYTYTRTRENAASLQRGIEMNSPEDYGKLDQFSDALSEVDDELPDVESKEERHDIDPPDECPACGASWIGFTKKYTVFADGDQVQCSECGYTKYV